MAPIGAFRPPPLFRGVPSWASEFLDRWLETGRKRQNSDVATLASRLRGAQPFLRSLESWERAQRQRHIQPQFALLFFVLGGCWWSRSESPGLIGICKASMAQAEGRAAKCCIHLLKFAELPEFPDNTL